MTPPPLLWGEWRCTTDPRTFMAECTVCGGQVIINRRGLDEWRAACANGCSREDMDRAAAALLVIQRHELNYPDERAKTMNVDDPLAGIDAETYIEKLCGREAKRGFVQCPFHGDGEERTPSLHVNGPLWYCHGCGKGGSVYDFGAELWGIEPRREGFEDLRVRLVHALDAGRREIRWT